MPAIMKRHFFPFLLTVCVIFLALLSCNGSGSSYSGERVISTDELPEAAKAFLNTHFADVRVKEVVLQHRASLTEYEVDLKGGTDLHFDRKGACTEVFCTKGSVPESVIPEVILQQITQKRPNPVIIKYEHENRLYEVRLNDGTEFTFNQAMRLINIDYDD